jgi:hypothetical protein
MHGIFKGNEFQPPTLKNYDYNSIQDYLHKLSGIIPAIKEIKIQNLDFENLVQHQWPTVTLTVEAFGKVSDQKVVLFLISHP